MYDISFFNAELSMIKDSVLAQMVKEEMEAAPQWFWSAPASSTGKHHPLYALGDGGLCRHIKCVASLVVEYCEALGLRVDRVLSAALLHDLYKFGGGAKMGNHPAGKRQYRVHGELCSTILSIRLRGMTNREMHDNWSAICKLVARHMGKYSPLKRSPDTGEGVALHLADVTASRRSMIYQPMAEEADKINKE